MNYDKRSVLLSAKGGLLRLIDAYGEIAGELAIPPGRVSLSDYLDLVPDGGGISVSDGLVVVQPRGLIGPANVHADALDSGANPDWRPTASSQLERQMRMMIAEARDNAQRYVDARLSGLSAVERVPQAPADEVIEPLADDKP